MDRTYPYKIDHVYQNEKDVKPQQILHPIFFGCFDWHSSAHGHWALVRILNAFPQIANRDEIEKNLNSHFKSELVKGEVAYFQREDDARKSERPYGYAWFLQLMKELRESKNSNAKKWIENLNPLELVIKNRFMDYLKVFDFPIRRGVHENSSFALSLAYDYGQATKDKIFLGAIIEKAKNFYFKDTNCPIAYEPEGDDFISPCLTEADLMRRVLSSKDFLIWFEKFWPHSKTNELKVFLKPLSPTSINDPKAVHLVGLDFEKAWTLENIANALPKSDPRRELFLGSSRDHGLKGFELISKSGYEGTHWLASFATYYFSDANH